MDEKYQVFVEAFRGMCQNNPLPPLPYPSTARRLKRLKATMKIQKNRDRWLAAIPSVIEYSNGYKCHPWRLDYRNHLEKVAEDCKLPREELLTVATLLFGQIWG